MELPIPEAPRQTVRADFPQGISKDSSQSIHRTGVFSRVNQPTQWLCSFECPLLGPFTGPLAFSLVVPDQFLGQIPPHFSFCHLGIADSGNREVVDPAPKFGTCELLPDSPERHGLFYPGFP